MSAAFYWDQGGAAKDPKKALEGLRGNQAKESLSGFGKDYARGVEVPKDYALFMSGTTSELQEAIKYDMEHKIPSICVPQGYLLDVRYIRRTAGRETKSLIGIASCDSLAKGSYWGLNYDGKSQDKVSIWVDPNRYPWHWLGTFGIADGYDYGYGKTEATLLLRNLFTLIAKGRGEGAWM